MKQLFTLILTLISLAGFAQTDSTGAGDFDFENFTDADEKQVKNYCTQKVINLSPTKLISIGYEAQMPFHMEAGSTENHVNRFGGFRAAFNAPVISKSSMILNLGVSAWNTNASFEKNTTFQEFRALNSMGVNATLFKPFNTKNFLIVQGSVDANSNNAFFKDFSNNAVTVSGAAVYGWKKSDYAMFGVGIARTYRAGQLLHVPAILWNKTFNTKTGVEMLLPARANFRYNFSVNSLLLLGYEIEGNAYTIDRTLGPTYLRRGELKPRIAFEKQLKNFIWMSAQVGWRYNYRFSTFGTVNPSGDNVAINNYVLGNPLYFNLSLNLVSP